jgi:hypothetical protein
MSFRSASCKQLRQFHRKPKNVALQDEFASGIGKPREFRPYTEAEPLRARLMKSSMVKRQGEQNHKLYFGRLRKEECGFLVRQLQILT